MIKLIVNPPLRELKIKDDIFKNIKDTRKVFEIIGKYAVGIARIKYLSGERPKNLGVVTGRLMKSVHTSIDYRKDSVIMKFGTDVYYGKYHEQLETDGRSSGRLPKRPFLVPSIIDAFAMSPEKIIEDIAWRKVMKVNLMKMSTDLKRKNKRGPLKSRKK